MQEIQNREDLDLNQYFKECIKSIDFYLDQHCPTLSGPVEILNQSMRYSLFAGGKRVRPILALTAFQACGGKGNSIFYATSALEMFHTFSLIHDDLPCMDDDDFRRGKPTNHKVYGEATAVLAGDALCILAFELLARTQNTECILTISKALGLQGMLGGQIRDILSEGKKVSIAEVDFIHTHKTAALIEASLVMGAQLAGSNSQVIEAFSTYGKKIGLAFQIVDDILDIVQTTETLGKDAGSDTERNKATYPSILGLEKSKEIAEQLKIESEQALKGLPINPTILNQIAHFIIHRIY